MHNKSIYRTLAFGLLGAALLFCTKQSAAQSLESCSPAYEEIIPLRAPDFSEPFLWRRVVGRSGFDWFRDLVYINDTDTIAVGASTKNIENPEQARSLFLVRLDGGGHIVRERRIALDGLDNVIAAERIGNHLFVLAGFLDKGHKQLRLLRMGFDGEDLKSLSFDDAAYQFYGADMIINRKDEIILSINKVKRSAHDAENDAVDDVRSARAGLYAYNKDLKQKWSRHYMPDSANQFNKLSLNERGILMAAGRINVEQDRDAGWMINLDDAGSLYWQNSFARGKDAELVKVLPLQNKGFVGAGMAWAQQKGDSEIKQSALWIMMSDGTGQTVWQRFITGRGKYSFTAVDMHVMEDGRIVVLVNAAADKLTESLRSHIRLMTFSPQGTILQDLAFVEGAESRAHHLLVTKEGQYRIPGVIYTGYSEDPLHRERYLKAGTLQQIEPSAGNETGSLLYRNEAQTKSVDTLTARAWLLAVSRPKDYKNPCR